MRDKTERMFLHYTADPMLNFAQRSKHTSPTLKLESHKSSVHGGVEMEDCHACKDLRKQIYKKESA